MTHLAARTVAADSRPAAPRRLLEGRIIEALLVIYFPLMIAVEWSASDGSSPWVGLLEATITAVAWFCAAWTVGWIAWRVKGGRGRLGQTLFGVSLVALVSSSVAMAALQRSRAEATAEQRFRDAGLAFLDALERATDDRGASLHEADAMRAFAGEMQRYAPRLEDAQRGRALAGAAILHEQAPLTDTLNRAGKAFVDAGGLSPAALDSEGAVDRRISLGQAYAEAIDRLAALQARRDERFAEVAALYGVREGDLAEARVWFERCPAGAEHGEVVRFEREVADAALGILRLMRDEWGRWRFDRAARRIIFDREATENRYVALYVALTHAETQKRSLQRRLLADSRRRLSEPDPDLAAPASADLDGGARA